METNKELTFVDTLWNTMVEYIHAWNEEAKRQGVNNVYKMEIVDSDKPLKAGDVTYNYYKTLKLTVKSDDGEFLLYIAHAPLKNITEGMRSKKWKLDLLKDLMYQMFTNYTVMVHSHILATENNKRKVTKQIGNLVDMDGRPLTREIEE